jgi:hypothetical protein
MSDLKRYYDEEMRHLHESGREFAHEHPEAARLLAIDEIEDRRCPERSVLELFQERVRFARNQPAEQLDDGHFTAHHERRSLAPRHSLEHPRRFAVAGSALDHVDARRQISPEPLVQRLESRHGSARSVLRSSLSRRRRIRHQLAHELREQNGTRHRGRCCTH